MSISITAKNVGIKFPIKSFSSDKFKAVIGIDQAVNNEFWALRNINFEVESGDILGVIGGNGSGKSTLLRTIANVYDTDEGTLEVAGSVSPLLSLGTGFKNELSGEENIYINGAIMGFKLWEIKKLIKSIIAFSELGNFIYQPVKNYSTGMRARLGFAIACHMEKEIMLIDEILGVGDKVFKEKSKSKMQELITDGRTVVLVSHSIETLKSYCNKILWIQNGKQIAFDETQIVLNKYNQL